MLVYPTVIKFCVGAFATILIFRVLLSYLGTVTNLVVAPGTVTDQIFSVQVSYSKTVHVAGGDAKGRFVLFDALHLVTNFVKYIVQCPSYSRRIAFKF